MEEKNSSQKSSLGRLHHQGSDTNGDTGKAKVLAIEGCAVGGSTRSRSSGGSSSGGGRSGSGSRGSRGRAGSGRAGRRRTGKGSSGCSADSAASSVRGSTVRDASSNDGSRSRSGGRRCNLGGGVCGCGNDSNGGGVGGTGGGGLDSDDRGRRRVGRRSGGSGLGRSAVGGRISLATGDLELAGVVDVVSIVNRVDLEGVVVAIREVGGDQPSHGSVVVEAFGDCEHGGKIVRLTLEESQGNLSGAGGVPSDNEGIAGSELSTRLGLGEGVVGGSDNGCEERESVEELHNVRCLCVCLR